jgi:hypothetical protein
MRAGFGCVLDLDPIQPGDLRSAAYVSKYVSKATDARDEVPWVEEFVDTVTGEVFSRHVEARYRTWSASRQWGPTMKVLRQAVRDAARARAARLASLPVVPGTDAPDGEQSWLRSAASLSPP